MQGRPVGKLDIPGLANGGRHVFSHRRRGEKVEEEESGQDGCCDACRPPGAVRHAGQPRRRRSGNVRVVGYPGLGCQMLCGEDRGGIHRVEGRDGFGDQPPTTR